ncbi:Peptidyl-tRNA hydrolase PTH2 [Novymonas esmeraldas]|uniref:peptidyl-tRNA hydrolase n=1 Tax=Novymonas esmeraldas TaxID=1808958 RepID=A0AAW0F5A7_9TRYP
MSFEAVPAATHSVAHTLWFVLHAVVLSATDAEDAATAAPAVVVRRTFWIGFATAFALTCAAALPFMKSVLASLLSWPARTCRQVSHLAATGEAVKMVLVVRKDLKMGQGKTAAQSAHAAVAVVEEILALRSESAANPEAALDPVSAAWLQWYDAWHLTGCSKVALQCADEAAMLALAKHARQMDLPHYVVRDAGRTQVAPGSRTVVAIGPGPKSLVDEVTGQLKLL